MEQLNSNWKNFYEIWYLDFCQNFVEKIQVLLKSDKNNVLYKQTFPNLWYLAKFFLEWEVFKKKFEEEIKTHVLC